MNNREHFKDSNNREHFKDSNNREHFKDLNNREHFKDSNHYSGLHSIRNSGLKTVYMKTFHNNSPFANAAFLLHSLSPHPLVQAFHIPAAIVHMSAYPPFSMLVLLYAWLGLSVGCAMYNVHCTLYRYLHCRAGDAFFNRRIRLLHQNLVDNEYKSIFLLGLAF